MSRKYAVRYMVETWDKPPQKDDTKGTVRLETREGVELPIRVSNSDYGYADRLFVASVVMSGSRPNVLLLDSTQGEENLSREFLEMIRDQIEHYLEHHVHG